MIQTKLYRVYKFEIKSHIYNSALSNGAEGAAPIAVQIRSQGTFYSFQWAASIAVQVQQ